MVQKCKDINAANVQCSTALYYAAICSEPDSTIAIFLRAGANPAVSEEERGETPLHLILRFCQDDQKRATAACLLLEHGADPDAEDFSRETPRKWSFRWRDKSLKQKVDKALDNARRAIEDAKRTKRLEELNRYAMKTRKKAEAKAKR